jgi:ABC-type branched-subunit amino acid transport system ATPase component
MMLVLKNISAAYVKDNLILEDLSMTLQEGERVAILGRNGAGKSTLAKSIMGMVPHRRGKVICCGSDISNLPVHQMSRRGIGYFHQGGQVFPQMTLEENLRFARYSARARQGFDNNQLGKYLPVISDRQFQKMKAGDLSGGERTQLALAMVIANKPDLLILDEPFAGISPGITESIIGFLQNRQIDWNYTLMLIEQNQYLAQRLCKNLFVLKNKKIIPFLEK